MKKSNKLISITENYSKYQPGQIISKLQNEEFRQINVYYKF